MGPAVRETICTNCVHNKVCAYTKDYVGIVERLQDVFEAFQPANHDKSFMILKDPDCKYCINKKLHTPIFSSRSEIGDTNSSGESSCAEGYTSIVKI